MIGSALMKSTCSWVNVFILSLFTLILPSWMIWRVSHISLADPQCETHKNSLRPRGVMMIVLDFRLHYNFLLSFLVQSSFFLLTTTLLTSCVGTNKPFFTAFHNSKFISFMKILIFSSHKPYHSPLKNGCLLS